MGTRFSIGPHTGCSNQVLYLLLRLQVVLVRQAEGTPVDPHGFHGSDVMVNPDGLVQ